MPARSSGDVAEPAEGVAIPHDGIIPAAIERSDPCAGGDPGRHGQDLRVRMGVEPISDLARHQGVSAP
jgi:hypothetical protein